VEFDYVLHAHPPLPFQPRHQVSPQPAADWLPAGFLRKVSDLYSLNLFPVSQASWRRLRPLVGPSHGTREGLAFQISAAYSAMLRSLENLPELATFRIAFVAHSSG
jgi:hypothetical protein